MRIVDNLVLNQSFWGALLLSTYFVVSSTYVFGEEIQKDNLLGDGSDAGQISSVKDDESTKQNSIVSEGTSDSTQVTEEVLPPINQYLPEIIPYSPREQVNVDTLSGAFVYTYDLVFPPGRNGMTPSLSLTYNSQSHQEGLLGYGWTISIPYIERLNKKGVETMYSESYFYSSFDGELVSDDGIHYYPKVEQGSFLKYEFTNNTWRVVDKEGMVYVFGETSESRQDDPSNASHVFRWMLESKVDTHENKIFYAYTKDSGAIYPQEITYGTNSDNGHVLKVVFTLEQNSNNPPRHTTGFPVEIRSRIKQIETQVDTDWVKKYTFLYGMGDNGKRLLISSIQESGRDEASNNVITLPATQFTYSTSTIEWEYDNDWNLPIPFIYGGRDYGMRTTDINGDGLVDVLCGSDVVNDPCGRNNEYIVINGNPGWYTSHGWDFPQKHSNPSKKEVFLDANNDDTGLRLVDITGDNLPDLVSGKEGSLATYVNTGTEWVYDSNWNLPIPIISRSENDLGLRFSDINGDGLIDIICANDVRSVTCGRDEPTVYINTGYGWRYDGNWEFPPRQNQLSKKEFFIDQDYKDTGLRLFDINNDHLADLVRGVDDLQYVYINTGYGWVYKSNIHFGLPFIYNVGRDHGIRVEDVNGDGLLDGICSNAVTNAPCGEALLYLNKGAGSNVSQYIDLPFVYPNTTKRETFVDYEYKDTGLRFFDINGDVIPDLVRNDRLRMSTYISKTKIPSDLLIKVTYPTEGTTDIVYQPTTFYVDENNSPKNPKITTILETVATLMHNDGMGGLETKNYFYEGGIFSQETPHDRVFAGFSNIIETNSEGTSKTTWFHQGNSTDTIHGEFNDDIAKRGKVYRSEIRDTQSNLVQMTLYKWDMVPTNADGVFIKNTQTVIMDYDGNSDHRDKAISYTYDDTNGNIIQKKEWGEVIGSDDGSFIDIETDSFVTNTTYATNPLSRIKSMPSEELVLNQSGSIEKQKRWYYDNEPLGSVLVGNLTKEEQRIDDSRYGSNEYTYDAYGMVTQSRDARGNTTTYVYDDYHLYPRTVTNALGHQNVYTYDYSSGKITSVTDPNQRRFESSYDGLDRLLQEKIPDPTGIENTVVKKSYSYFDTLFPRQVKEVVYLDELLTSSKYSYFDGLNRLIQERKGMEDQNHFAVTSYLYDERDHLYKTSLPYEEVGFGYTQPTNILTLYTTTLFDPVDRPKIISDSIGTTQYAYDQWRTTITDPKGNNKELHYDAHDRIVSVVEHNLDNAYTTQYTYNYQGGLMQIIDAQENIRRFDYDGLGRRILSEDLHTPSDTVFGIWKYVYDVVGNLIRQTNPEGIIVTWLYDALNRVTMEDSDSTPDVDKEYLYDVCMDGVGRVCQVSTPDITTTYEYDSNGNVAGEDRTLNGKHYITQYSYGRQAQHATVMYPDKSKAEYVYNQGGQVEQVNYTPTGGVKTSVLTNINYGPDGRIEELFYGNGGHASNVYDQNQNYRLILKTTIIPSEQGNYNAQKLNYTYDVLGNIIQIIDSSDTATAKTSTYAYDDLSRLLSAEITDASSSGNYIRTYEYDSLGNIMNSNGVPYSYVDSGYTNPHAVTQVGTSTLTYDRNGNLLSHDGLSYQWNYLNQIRQVTRGLDVTLYGYDHTGDRVFKKDDSNTDYSLSNYTDIHNDVTYNHVYLGNEQIATYQPFSVTHSSDTYQTSGLYTNTFKQVTEKQEGTGQADLSLRLLTFAEPLHDRVGESYIFDAQYLNNGKDLATNSTVTITFDPDMVGVPIDYINTATSSCTQTATEVSCIVGDILADGHEEGLRFKVILVGAGTTTINVSITSDAIDPNGEDNSVSKAFFIDEGNLWQMVYHHTDHLGSTNIDTNENGGILSVFDYYPYGNLRIEENGGDYHNPYQYIGQEYDEESKLSYLNARYYSGQRGQFLSQDPMFWATPLVLLTDPQQLNAYSYARNNPIINKDSTGLYNLKTGTVEKGDTLSEIRSQINKINGTSYSISQLANLNNISNPDRISIGQTIKPNNSVPDVTRLLNNVNQLHSTVARGPETVGSGISNSTPQSKGIGTLGFADKFKPGGDWDLKSQDIENGIFCQQKSCGGQRTESYIFNAQEIPGDAPGNIHYGYIGKEARYSLGTLLFFGDAVQTLSHLGQFGDPQSDKTFIRQGYGLSY